MKRFILSFVMLGVCAMVTGCADETKKEVTSTVKTPTGSEKTTVTEKKEVKGDGAAGTTKP